MEVNLCCFSCYIYFIFLVLFLLNHQLTANKLNHAQIQPENTPVRRSYKEVGMALEARMSLEMELFETKAKLRALEGQFFYTQSLLCQFFNFC